MMTDTMEKSMTIKDIEALTEPEAAAIAVEKIEIKEHTVYLADIPGYFGYSALVFKDGHHIHYANDYELHHKPTSWGEREPYTQEKLRAMYIDGLAHKLYTEEEIAEPLTDYDEYTAKSHYLHNYYGMRKDYVSIFCCNPTEKQQKDFERKTKDMVYNPIAFAYMDDKEFVKHHIGLYNTLCQRMEEVKDNYEYQKKAFRYELGNHEYHINTYQGDWDTLSAFGNIEWHGQGRAARERYYDELGFTETQRRAFEDARVEFLREAEEKDWY